MITLASLTAFGFVTSGGGYEGAICSQHLSLGLRTRHPAATPTRRLRRKTLETHEVPSAGRDRRLGRGRRHGAAHRSGSGPTPDTQPRLAQASSPRLPL